jgi:CelD/BcsL family acetyltransferase involved in cellulose biosynthesis
MRLTDFMTFAPRAQFSAVEINALAVAAEPAFDFASAEYQALQQRSRSTAFQGARWLAALHRGVAPAFAAEPITITLRDADGRLMLVLPLARRRQNGLTILAFADFGLCDYLGAVYDPAEAPLIAADATLPRRLAAALPRHDVTALTKLTGDDALLEWLFPDMRRARMRVSAYPAPMGRDWTAWRDTKLDQSFRRYLDMKRRRLERTGKAEFVLLLEADAIARAFEALRRYRSQRFKALGAPDVLDDEAVYSFYLRNAIEGAQDESARTQCLCLAGVPIAITFGSTQRGVYSLLLVGFDAARHSRLSPGLLAIEDTLRASVEAGDGIFDFTIGDHPFKLQFGGQAIPLYEWHQARTIRGHVAVIAIALMREAKRMLRPLLARRKSTAARPAAGVSEPSFATPRAHAP